MKSLQYVIGAVALFVLAVVLDLLFGTSGVVMAAVAGLRGTGDWGTDERPTNFREAILWRRPNGKALLTALTAKMKSESVDDPQYSWWEEELNSIRVTVNFTTGYASTANSIVVDGGDAQDLVPGDVLLVEAAITTAYAHEILVVSAVSSTTALDVKRGQAGSTQATLPDNAVLLKIGNVYAEGTTSPNASTRNPTKLFNYCQIFKTAYEVTETAKKTYARTGNALTNDKKRKMFDHSVGLEWSWMFGKRHETTGSNGKPLRFTGGILFMMATYFSSAIKAYTTTPTEKNLLDDIYRIWDYDTDAGNERIAFCGNGFLNSLNKLALNSSATRINQEETVKVYGMELTKWVFPQGTILFKTHPLFNTSDRWSNDAVILDPSVLRYRYVRDTKSQSNIQANDADTEKGQWLSECGMEFNHAKTAKWLSNFVVP